MKGREIAGNQATGVLKLIALVCMIIDHIGVAFYPQQLELRVIGRIAFPLYAWCLAVGACHTRSMGRYMLRILLVGVISQPLYVLAFNHAWTDLNIFFTLALGLYAIWGIREKRLGSQFWAPALALIAAMLIACDYGWKGVLLPVMLYLLRKKRWQAALGMAIFCFFWEPNARSVGGLFGVAVSVLEHPVLYELVMPWFRLQALAILSLPLMLIRFPRDIRLPAWVSYGLYPAHLAVIYVLRLVL